LPNAGAAIRRALELAPHLAEAHAVHAHFQSVADLDNAASVRTLTHAISLDPQCFWGHRGLGRHYLLCGEFDAALAAFRRAQAIQPIAVNINGNIGMVHYFAGRYREAIAQFELTLRMDAAFDVARSFLGRCYVRLGALEHALQLFEGPRVAHGAEADIPIVHALSGRTALAKAALGRLLERAAGDEVAAAEIAALLTALGDHERAIAWLERAVEQRRHGFFPVDPIFAPLRSQPRFERLVERMGLREPTD
jgi:tetratricopeptide (TPR) repeat protein